MERVTVTVDKGLLASVDARVDGKKFKNRSHAFNALLRKALLGGELSKAFVLAGGRTDLKRLETLFAHFRAYGLKDVVLGVCKDSEKIFSHFKNGEGFGLSVSYAWDDYKGSALALEGVKDLFSESFLLSYADVLYPALDLKDLYAFHKANGGVCTLALASVSDPTGLGVAEMRGSKITDFKEKPRKAESFWVNAGAAVCEPTIFSFITRGMKRFEDDLLPLLAKKGLLFGYAYSGEWTHLR